MCAEREARNRGNAAPAAIAISKGDSMTITVVFDFPQAALTQYQDVFNRGGTPVVNQPDRIFHQCFENGDGLTVIDIWASEDAFTAFGEVLGPILQEVGLSTVPKIHRTCRTVDSAGHVVDF